MKQIEELYLQYRTDLYHYLLSLTHNPTLSEDLLSETFVRAIGSIHGFRGESSIKTWLFSIARNLWFQRLRREKDIVEYNDLLGLYVGENMVDKMTTKELANRIKGLLMEKDERTRRIMQLRIEGYSFTEIAQQVGISESSARVIAFRTRKWLMSILKKEGLI